MSRYPWSGIVGQGSTFKSTARKALRKHPNINPREIFDDPDPDLVKCVKMLIDVGFGLAEACKAAVALKREYEP